MSRPTPIDLRASFSRTRLCAVVMGGSLLGLSVGCTTTIGTGGGPDALGVDTNPDVKTPDVQDSVNTDAVDPATTDDFIPNPGQPTEEEPTTSAPPVDTAPPDITHLQYLVVTPGDQIVELDLGATHSIAYQAMGYYSDGKQVDLTKEVTWSLGGSNTGVGAFKDHELTLAPHDELFVQSTMVTATLDTIQAQAQVTVAAYEQDGTNPDFLFVLPYEDKDGSKSKSLSFRTKVQALDVFFSVDTTSSMEDEIEALRNALSTTIVPTLQREIPNTQFGVGGVEDFPVGTHGHRSDQPFELKQLITSDIDAVQRGVANLTLGRGGDFPESVLEGLYQVATGEGLTGPSPTFVASSTIGIGGVGFREGTMPIVISITDATSHAPGETDDGCNRGYETRVSAVAHTREQTEKALEDICARVITVASAGMGGTGNNEQCKPRVDGERLADATDARVSPLVWDKNRPSGCGPGECCTGINGRGLAPDADGLCSLVFDVDAAGRGLDESIVSGVEALAFFAPFDVVTEKEGESASVQGKALPSGVSTLDFLKSVRAQGFGDLPLPGLPKPVPEGDTFKNVTPGTEISFTLEAFNGIVRQTTSAQVFRAKIGVKADQCDGLALDKRNLVFVVPPKPLVAG